MSYKIITRFGYNVTSDREKAMSLIDEYKHADIYVGMQFLPFYSGIEQNVNR